MIVNYTRRHPVKQEMVQAAGNSSSSRDLNSRFSHSQEELYPTTSKADFINLIQLEVGKWSAAKMKPITVIHTHLLGPTLQ